MLKNTLGLLAVAALATGSSVASAAALKLEATLGGANETGGGDPDGTGSFSGEFDTETGDVCYVLTAGKVAKPTAAHIHEGAAGSDGKPVITSNQATFWAALRAAGLDDRPDGYGRLLREH